MGAINPPEQQTHFARWRRIMLCSAWPPDPRSLYSRSLGFRYNPDIRGPVHPRALSPVAACAQRGRFRV